MENEPISFTKNYFFKIDIMSDRLIEICENAFVPDHIRAKVQQEVESIIVAKEHTLRRTNSCCFSSTEIVGVYFPELKDLIIHYYSPDEMRDIKNSLTFYPEEILGMIPNMIKP